MKELIDTLTEAQKPLVAQARKYDKAKNRRMADLEIEVDEKNKLRDMVRKSDLLPLESGKIVFVWKDITIETWPQEDKIKVTIKDE